MKCLVCGAQSKACPFPRGVTPVLGETKFKCARCSHTWLRLSEVAAKTFHHTEVTWRYNDFQIRDGYHNTRIDIIKKALKWPPKSALDVGCGDGRFLEIVNADTMVGVDLNDEIPDNTEFEYLKGSFLDVEINKKFDLVTSFHSLEHVKDAIGFFKKLQSLSKSVIAIEVPVRRKMGRFNGHIHGFNGNSFNKFIELHKGKFETIATGKNIQNSSSTWIGRRS